MNRLPSPSFPFPPFPLSPSPSFLCFVCFSLLPSTVTTPTFFFFFSCLIWPSCSGSSCLSLPNQGRIPILREMTYREGKTRQPAHILLSVPPYFYDFLSREAGRRWQKLRTRTFKKLPMEGILKYILARTDSSHGPNRSSCCGKTNQHLSLGGLIEEQSSV